MRNSCVRCIAIFERALTRLAPSRVASEPKIDDRARLVGWSTQRTEPHTPPASVESWQSRNTTTPASRKVTPPLQIPEPKTLIVEQKILEPPPKPRGPWVVQDPPPPFFQISTAPAPFNPYGDVSPLGDEPSPRLISKEAVNSQIHANNDLLERRRLSRLLWQDEFRKSGASLDDHRVSLAPSDASALVSPILGRSVVSSPIDFRTPNPRFSSSELLARKPSHASQHTQSSHHSSHGHDRSRQDSQESIFGNRVAAPLSPPLTANNDSGASRPQSRTEQGTPSRRPPQNDPSFGRGVEDGIQVVNDDSQGLIVVGSPDSGSGSSFRHRPTTASLRSIDHPMTPYTSFGKFGGFCEGAVERTKGDAGYRQVRIPSGTFNSTTVARCRHCAFEVDWRNIHKDNTLDPTGVHRHDKIRFRQRFLWVSHVKTKSADEPLYAVRASALIE